MPHYGIDEASWQDPMVNGVPTVIDQNAVVADLKQRGGGLQPFELIKVTQGVSYTNPAAKTQAESAKAAGAVIAYYHFLTTEADAQSQLVYFNAACTALGVVADSKGWSDVEAGGLLSGTWEDLAAIAKEFSADDSIEGNYFNQETLANVPEIPFGKASWFADPSNTMPSEPRDIWQNGQSEVAGLPGMVDINVMPESSFAKIFGTTPVTTVVDPVDPSTPIVEPTPSTSNVPEQGVNELLPVIEQNSPDTVYVKRCQALLVANGSVLAIDGAFGQITLREVLAFQHNNGLTADGIVGPLTWGKLLGL